MKTVEVDVLIKSTCDSVLPKLVAEDIPLFTSLLQAVFPGSELPRVNDANLLAAIKTVCEADSLDMSDEWVQKVFFFLQNSCRPFLLFSFWKKNNTFFACMYRSGYYVIT